MKLAQWFYRGDVDIVKKYVNKKLTDGQHDNRRTTSDHAEKSVTLLDIRTLCYDIKTDKK